ncbi:MAG: carboxypeptidase regulatory-like domain-containing protein [Candidatus Solibacter sp.]
MRWMCALLLMPLALAGQTAGDEAASISGSVANAVSGEPLRRALIYLRRIDASPGVTNMQVSKTTYTDAAGRFTLEGIAPGKYRLSAERQGFLTASYGQRTATGSGTLMSIDPGQKMTDAAMRMMPHAVITGRVVDEDGDPLVSATVQVMRQQYVQGKKQLSGVAGGNTNDLGEYRVFGLRPGRYYVTVTSRSNPVLPDGADDYVATYFPRTTDPTAAVPVDVTPGAQLRNIDVAMRKQSTVTVRGKVTNEIPPATAAEGSQRLNVMLTPRFSGMGLSNSRGATVTPQNTFELRGVTPGNYFLSAVAMGGGKTIATKIPIQVGNSPLEGLSLVIRAGVPVAGKLKVEGDLPANLERVRLSLNPEEMSGVQLAPWPSSTLRPDGGFQFEEVGSDRYTVGVGNLPDGFFVKSIRSANLDVLAAGIEIAGQAPAPLEVLLSANAGQITGAVVDKAQKPAVQVTVVLVPQDKTRRDKQQYYRTATTSLTGSFAFKDVIPGEYRVFAWDEVEFGAWMDPDFLKPVESRGEAASVAEGARLTVQVNLISADSQ